MAPASVMDKVGKLLRLLASDKNGEVLATVGALKRTLGGANLSLHDLADMIEKHGDGRADGAATWTDVVEFCRGHPAQLRGREHDFIQQMAAHVLWRAPTRKQGKWILSIYLRLGGTGSVPSC